MLDWISGTALLPVSERLNEQEYQQFRQELIPLLAGTYPARPRRDHVLSLPASVHRRAGRAGSGAQAGISFTPRTTHAPFD